MSTDFEVKIDAAEKTVEKAAAELRRARHARNTAVLAQHESGVSLGEIARQRGVTFQRIQQIVLRARAGRAS